MRSLTLRAAALKRRFLRLNSFHLFSDNWSISLSSNFGTHIQGCCGHVCFLYHLFRWSNGWLEVCIKRHHTVLFVLNGSFFIQLLKPLGHWGIFMRSILFTLHLFVYSTPEFQNVICFTPRKIQVMEHFRGKMCKSSFVCSYSNLEDWKFIWALQTQKGSTIRKGFKWIKSARVSGIWVTFHCSGDFFRSHNSENFCVFSCLFSREMMQQSFPILLNNLTDPKIRWTSSSVQLGLLIHHHLHQFFHDEAVCHCLAGRLGHLRHLGPPHLRGV